MREQLQQLWPSAENVAACIRHEAETVDPAVFLAVHQPMQFIREEVGAKRGQGERRTEQDLFDEFMTSSLPDGVLIMPIVGSSGVGKSHVIRWLAAQLERREDRAKRHVIRIPKGTSLKGVLRQLLDGLKGPAYDPMRESLLKAREQLEPELAARHLMLNLRHRLETEAESAAQRIRDDVPLPDDKLVRDYGNRRALPMLLGDSELEQGHWLTLPNGEQGVIAKMAVQVTEESVGEEDTRKHQFSADDLRVDPKVVERLNQGSQRFYRRLLSNARSDRLAEAAKVLNRVLDAAKQDLLQLGDGSLTDLFRKVREQLYRDGQELLLLVEDFAVLSGMQGALLQVMITEAVRDGKQVLCTMRSALAYTEGYANVPETVLTRARSRWIIEDVPGDSHQIISRVERLVGAYLNAARVGQAGLQEAFGSASAEGNWIPIAQGEGLEDEVRATLEAFGQSEDGYPLFPFNAGAIHQLSLQGSTKGGHLVFNPRAVINNVLRKTLPMRGLFGAGSFPPAHLNGEPLLSVDVTTAVGRRVRGPDRQRTLDLLALWGDQPTTVAQAAALPVKVYGAFGLECPRWGVKPEQRPTPVEHRGPRPSPRDSAPTPGTSHPQLDPREQKWLDVLQGWAAGETMLQSRARQLRSWIAEAMLAYLPWNHLLHKSRYKGRDLTMDVYIARAQGQERIGKDQAFVLAVPDESLSDPVKAAQVVRTLRAFVRLHDIHKAWNYEGADADAALYASFIAQRAPHAERWLRSRFAYRKATDTTPALTEFLLMGSRALGVDGARSNQESSRLNSLFAESGEVDIPSESTWGQLKQQFIQHRPIAQELLLAQVGARQGTGTKIYAVDWSRIRTTLREVHEANEFQHRLPRPKQDSEFTAVGTAHSDLRRRLPSVLRQERETLVKWFQDASVWFGENPDKTELIATLRETVRRAKADAPSSYDHDALRRKISKLRDLRLKGALASCARLLDSDATGVVLSVLAEDPHPVTEATRELMEAIEHFLGFHEREIETRLRGLGENALQEQTQAVSAELDGLEAVLTRIEEARS